MIHGLVLKKVHRVIKFNPKAWLKSYVDMNTKLWKNAKKWLHKKFVQVDDNAVFGKTMENVRRHGYIPGLQQSKQEWII